MSAYIANAVRENHHHHDKREHTTKMTVSVKPTYKLSQPHKYGYEYNNRRICSANGGLPPAVKRKKYYESLVSAA